MDAIAIAAAMIRSGEAEFAIAGGADAPITPLAMASFIASGLSSYRNGEPEKASRPFDLGRDSGVISEGAGILILENLERAEARGARIYLEISGYGMQRDLASDQPASGLERSMKIAMANAGVDTQGIDYICAYGPGHPILDAVEVAIIKKVFGDRAYSIPVSSIKGVTGNPLAAGGPFQIAACALSIRDQTLIPTANYELPDPLCDLDVIPNRPRKSKVNCALINVRGLGGSASSLVVNRVDGCNEQRTAPSPRGVHSSIGARDRRFPGQSTTAFQSVFSSFVPRARCLVRLLVPHLHRQGGFGRGVLHSSGMGDGNDDTCEPESSSPIRDQEAGWLVWNSSRFLGLAGCECCRCLLLSDQAFLDRRTNSRTDHRD